MPTFPLAHGRFASLRFAFLFFSLIGAGALTPQAEAQVRYTGTAAAQNFGSQAVSVTSAAVSFPFSVAAGTTVGSVAVLTQGSPNLDFASVSGTTCAAQTYTSASTCAVNVTFTPKFAGARMGGIVFFSGGGNIGTVLGEVLVHGVGNGADIAYGPGTTIAIDPTVNGIALGSVEGLAIDGHGDLFIADSDNNRVIEIPAGGGAPSEIEPAPGGVGLNLPLGLAVDGPGDLFIADVENNRVVEVPAGGGAARAIDPTVDGLELRGPGGLAVDAAGDLFIADASNYRVVRIPAGGGAPSTIAPIANGVKMGYPDYLALDGAGDLFIGDDQNERVIEVPVNGDSAVAIAPTVNGVALYLPACLAADAAGDLFIADELNKRVLEVLAGGGTAEEVGAPAGWYPVGLAVDSAGNVFIGDYDDSGVVEIQHAQTPAFAFATSTPVNSVDAPDGPRSFQITNIGNQPLAFSALSYPADFSSPSGGSTTCSVSQPVNPGAQCQISVQFSPVNAGMLSEDVALTDNAANGAGQQSIAVSGTGLNLAFMTSPAPGSTLTGSAATFTWHPNSDDSAYALRLGTGLGGNNLYQSPTLTTTSATVTGLPMQSNNIYARLSSKLNGVWQYQDYVYIEAGTPTPAVLTSPSISTAIGPTTTFYWSAGTDVAEYFFELGTRGVGSYNVLNTGATSALNATVTGLPDNDEAVWARVGSKINGVWQTEDYLFNTYAPGLMTSPSSGAQLSGSTVTFKWIPGNGVSEYALRIGTGPGANNIYQSPNLTGTSLTVTGIPTTGAKIWVRLNSKANGEWLYQDYTYTEQWSSAVSQFLYPAWIREGRLFVEEKGTWEPWFRGWAIVKPL